MTPSNENPATGSKSMRFDKDEGLDVIAVIAAHMGWKMRLEAYINGTGTEKLDPNVVGRDDQCTLGKWIYSTGNTRYGHIEQFNELKNEHAQFHRCAADIIREADKGDKQAALKMLHEGGYAKCSYHVKTMLARVCRGTYSDK